MQTKTDNAGATPTAAGDPKANAVYCRITKHAVFKSIEVAPDVVIDYDAQGEVVGVEILGVRNPGGRWEVIRRD